MGNIILMQVLCLEDALLKNNNQLTDHQCVYSQTESVLFFCIIIPHGKVQILFSATVHLCILVVSYGMSIIAKYLEHEFRVYSNRCTFLFSSI